MNLNKLIKDLRSLQIKCSSKLIDLDEVDDELEFIISELKIIEKIRREG